MFEDSVFSSGRQASAARTRWAAVAAIGVQAAMVVLVLLSQLLWPATLPVVSAAPVMVALAKPKVKLEARPRVVRAAEAASPFSAPSPATAPEVAAVRGSGFSRILPDPAGNEPVLTSGGPGMGSGTNPLSGVGVGLSSVIGVLRASSETGSGTRLRISSGVSTGMLLGEIRPVYPRIALAAHVQGTVTVTATIDSAGRIVGAQVVSGPAMLRSAALNAVKEARYRPYRLNGEATEVETTISVEFRLGG